MNATVPPDMAQASTRRLRVLFVASHPVQYQAPQFRRFAAHPDLDSHVAYCSLKGAEAAHDPDFGTIVQWDVPLLSGYAWSQIPNKGSGSESFFGLRNPDLWRLIRTGNFDAVVSFVGYVRSTFWIALAAAKRSKTAFLFGTDATTLVPRSGRGWKREIKKILWPRLFRLADQVIVPSSGSHDLMIELGIPDDRVTVTPYTVNNDWWTRESQKADRSAVRHSWGASSEEKIILFCGKLQPWKRPFDLLRAFAQVKPSNALLIVAGDGPLRPALESEAEKLGVSSRVRFLGFLNQSALPAVYSASDLMVVPSEYEPFAVVVNEAMCCGCSVAASDRVGAVRDLVAPVNPFFVYPCGDVAALAKLLQAAVADGDVLRVTKQSSVKHMESWSPEKNISTTLTALERAVLRVRS